MSLTKQFPPIDQSALGSTGINNNNNNNNNTTGNHNDDSTNTDPALQSTSDSTPIALLEQLIYVENNFADSGFSSGSGFDDQINNDLSIFADESFIFPDDDKPKKDPHDNEGNSNNLFQDFNKLHSAKALKDVEGHGLSPLNSDIIPTSAIMTSQESQSGEKDIISESLVALLSSQSSNGTNPLINSIAKTLLSNLPKYDVPPGAKKSLSAAGISDIQIDALAALIHQQQQNKSNNGKSNDDEFAVQGHHSTNLFEDSVGSLLENINNNGNAGESFNFGAFTMAGASPAAAHDIFQDPGLSHEGRSDQFQLHARAFSTTSLPMPSSSSFNHSPGSDASSIYNGGGTSGSTNGTDAVKRRRNTAASARFRIKKRMREQEMERSIRELNDNAKKMRKKIEELETENRVLKNLIINRDGAGGVENGGVVLQGGRK